jgi:hypothetical protein
VAAIACGEDYAAGSKSDAPANFANAMTVQAEFLALTFATNAIGGDASDPMPIRGEHL